MEQFPSATELPKIFSLEGHEGDWNQVKYAEARINPMAVRALKKNAIAWFVPVTVKEIQEELQEELLEQLVRDQGCDEEEHI